jgi:hypothetical protein
MALSWWRRLGPVAVAGSIGVVAACGGAQFTSATGNDGGTGDDASSGDDGGDAAADAASMSWCETQPHHFLCDDFDKRVGDVKGTIWSGLVNTPQADMQITAADFTSPPRSLQVDTTQAHIQNQQTAALIAKSGVPARTIDLAFDIKVDQYGGDGTINTAAIFAAITYGDVSYQLGLTNNASLVFNELLTPDGGPSTSSPQTISTGLGSAWAHVEIQVQFPVVAVAGKVVVAIGGQTVFTHPLMFMAPPALADIAIGIALLNAPNIWKLHFDNVTIDRT